MAEDIYKQIDEKLNKIIQRQDDFELRLECLERKRNEMYYQKFLEKRLNATHKKTDYGITDLSTKNSHIEIKHWSDYKTALGQLLSYNFKDNKKLCVYFFGTVKDIQKTNILELFRSNNIIVYEFIDSLQGITINCLSGNECKKEENDFSTWLLQNIVYKENSILKLQETVELFLGLKIPSKQLNKYRKEIEIIIKQNFINIDYEYKQFWIKEIKYRGWKHLCLKNN